MQKDIAYLRQILSEKIIPPLFTEDSPRMVLAQHPWRLPADMKLRRRPAPSLEVNSKNQSGIVLSTYPQERVHAIRFPYFCYVLEGEIDMRLGIPVKEGKRRGVANTYEILTLPAHTALLIPPGTFFPNSSQPYWERLTTPADSSIFWAHVLPTGLFCHPSATRNALYGSQTPDIFVPGYQFSSLASMMVEELQSPSPEAHQIAQRILPLFFMMILRGLQHGTRANVTAHTSIPKQDPATKGSSIIIEQAREFIRKHKHQHFTIEDVAANAYVSSSHLMNLFRVELDITVMGYALEQRMETARAWLINSEMSVKDIARSLGYSQTPQFTRIFKQVHNSSPIEFRHQHRGANQTIKANE